MNLARNKTTASEQRLASHRTYTLEEDLYKDLSLFETLNSLSERSPFLTFDPRDTNLSITRKEIQAIVVELFRIENTLQGPKSRQCYDAETYQVKTGKTEDKSGRGEENFSLFHGSNKNKSKKVKKIKNKTENEIPQFEVKDDDLTSDNIFIQRITRRLNIYKTLSDRFSKKFYWHFSFEICSKILRMDKYATWYRKGDLEFVFYACLFICSKIFFDDGYLSLGQFCDVFGLRKKLMRETEISVMIYLLEFDFYGLLKKHGFFGFDEHGDGVFGRSLSEAESVSSMMSV